MLEKVLKKVEFLKKFNEKDIAQIKKIATIKKFPKGAVIFNKNEIGNYFFVVKSGKVKIYSSIGAKTKTFTVIGENNFFGEMSLLGCKNRSASAVTLEESQLYVISGKNFEKHLLKNPQLTIKLLYTLAHRLAKANEEIEALIFNNILGRLAKAVLEISNQAGKTKDIRINQTEIASYIGTTRVPVCRSISILKKKNIIGYENGCLYIKDHKKLSSMAGK